MLIEVLNKASKEIYEANKLKGLDVAESNKCMQLNKSFCTLNKIKYED